MVYDDTIVTKWFCPNELVSFLSAKVKNFVEKENYRKSKNSFQNKLTAFFVFDIIH
jgi:hypothetical protein